MPSDSSIESQITRLAVLMEEWEKDMKRIEAALQEVGQRVDRMGRQIERMATGYQQLREKVEAAEQDIKDLTSAFAPIDASYKSSLARGTKHTQLVTAVQSGISVLIVSFFLFGIVQPFLSHLLFPIK